MVVHCRVSTGGKVDLDNTHPFEIGPDMWLFHNGMFRVRIVDKDKSDTWHMARIIKNLIEEAPDFLVQSVFFKTVMDQWFGDYYSRSSKGVIFTPAMTHIIQEDGGIWRGGCWYSNHSAFPVARSIIRARRRGKSGKGLHCTVWTPKAWGVTHVQGPEGIFWIVQDYVLHEGSWYRKDKWESGKAGPNIPNSKNYLGPPGIGWGNKCSNEDCGCEYGVEHDVCPVCHTPRNHVRRGYLTDGGDNAGTVATPQALPLNAGNAGEGSNGDAPADDSEPEHSCFGDACDGFCDNINCEVRQVLITMQGETVGGRAVVIS